jgi:hypothetical protein
MGCQLTDPGRSAPGLANPEVRSPRGGSPSHRAMLPAASARHLSPRRGASRFGCLCLSWPAEAGRGGRWHLPGLPHLAEAGQVGSRRPAASAPDPGGLRPRRPASRSWRTAGGSTSRPWGDSWPVRSRRGAPECLASLPDGPRAGLPTAAAAPSSVGGPKSASRGRGHAAEPSGGAPAVWPPSGLRRSAGPGGDLAVTPARVPRRWPLGEPRAGRSSRGF